ncbi:hypothetical protein DFQ27_009553 [Actinomortierella ambigua]|uniref:Peptidase M20 domain-containing protein 2 n=1 Tax=Actinomortierella ambigua TaxID=1343610 RepID=A0A9P6QEJ8_9FUNG|nr:hypothetical protein DFQ27_009553 [Actinomortierella ambigua]
MFIDHAALKLASDEAIDKASGALRHISLEIHSHPELGWKEHFAHKILTDFLEEQGFKVTRGAFGLETAFIAEYESPEATKPENAHCVLTVGYCSEYDALPGVDLIAISGVAAALGTKAALEKTQSPGRVRLIGTPAEETTGGKVDLLKLGAFEGLAGCLMLHPANTDNMYVTMLGAGHLEVEYFGEAAQASTWPWKGVNALDAMINAYNGLAVLRQQMLPTSRLHCIITKGGVAANIIPEYASGAVMYRAVKNADLNKLRDQVVAILEAAAESTGCRVAIRKKMEYAPLKNNALMAEKYVHHMETSYGVRFQPRAVQESRPSGSTDMGNVSQALPAIHPLFSMVSLESRTDLIYPAHSAVFAEKAQLPVAHEAALRAAKGLALTGLDLLLQAGFASQVRDDFERTK